MTDIFFKIEESLAAKRPFAVYSKPGSKVVTGIFQDDDTAIFLMDFSQKGFVFAPFKGGNVCFIPADGATILSSEIEYNDGSISEPAPASIDETAKTNFGNLVAHSVAAIQQGQFKKLVVSRSETINIGSADITHIYLKLLNSYPAAFRYCFYHPYSGLWMGATPEQLLKVENDILKTVALAGTQLYTAGETAVWETKEREEQQFVTDYILNELHDHTDAITATKPYTFRAGNIVHIKTDILATLKPDNNLQDIINTLHPTPAVCGLPKVPAMQFLLNNEGYDREYYSGYLGELNRDFTTGNEKTDLFVNLRCMKIENGTANLYIGCGITKDSDPEKEFFETVNKSMTMRKVIAP